MLKLNQVIALEKGVKGRAEGALTQAYHTLQKLGPLGGISRTYRPRDDDGERLPSEGVKLQTRVEEVLDGVAKDLSRLFDLNLTKDAGNTIAVVDLKINGQLLVPQVPVTTLLTLEKKLVDLHTFVAKLPVLDPAENWSEDATSNAFRTAETQTTRTKKIPRNHVKAAATEKHPAQVEVYFEDAVVGDWTTVKFSGAITEVRRHELLAKVEALQAAVKVAREEANSVEVPDRSLGQEVFEFLGW